MTTKTDVTGWHKQVLLLNHKNSSDLGNDDVRGSWILSSFLRVTDILKLQNNLGWRVDVTFACKSIPLSYAASWPVKAVQKIWISSCDKLNTLQMVMSISDWCSDRSLCSSQDLYIFSAQLAQNYGTLPTLSRSKLFPSVNTSTLYINKLCDKSYWDN